MIDRIWIWFADNGNIRKWSTEPFEEGTEFLATTRSALPVGVKALEWPDECPRGQRVDSEGGLLEYSIIHYGGSEPDSGIIFRWAKRSCPWSGAFFAYEHAIAAAQADYERRVLSALTESPAVAGVTEEMVERFCRARYPSWDAFKPDGKTHERDRVFVALQAAISSPAEGGEKAVAWTQPSVLESIKTGAVGHVWAKRDEEAARRLLDFEMPDDIPLFTHPATDEIERVLKQIAYNSEDDAAANLARNLLLKLKGGR